MTREEMQELAEQYCSGDCVACPCYISEIGCCQYEIEEPEPRCWSIWDCTGEMCNY